MDIKQSPEYVIKRLVKGLEVIFHHNQINFKTHPLSTSKDQCWQGASLVSHYRVTILIILAVKNTLWEDIISGWTFVTSALSDR